MEAKELRTFTVDELKSRVAQWRDELFRARFKNQSSEAPDTSILRKLKRDIARGLMILGEKTRGSLFAPASAPQTAPAVAPAPEDQPVKKVAKAAAPSEEKAAKPKAKKTKTAKKKGEK